MTPGADDARCSLELAEISEKQAVMFFMGVG